MTNQLLVFVLYLFGGGYIRSFAEKFGRHKQHVALPPKGRHMYILYSTETNKCEILLEAFYNSGYIISRMMLHINSLIVVVNEDCKYR